MVSTTDAVTITNQAASLLQDPDNVHWTAAELLSWLNAGQLEIALLVPNSNTVTAAKVLVAGSKQSAPADSIRIIEFTRNMGLSGSVPGNAIRQVERKYLDAYLPDWAAVTASAEVIHAMYNAEDSNSVFYVYPPQPATPGYLELIYDQIPTAIASLTIGVKITVADYYANALLDYLLYRAFGKDSEYGNQAVRSQSHYAAFLNAIGAKQKFDFNANNKQPPPAVG